MKQSFDIIILKLFLYFFLEKRHCYICSLKQLHSRYIHIYWAFLILLLFFNLSVLNDTLPNIQLLTVDGESWWMYLSLPSQCGFPSPQWYHLEKATCSECYPWEWTPEICCIWVLEPCHWWIPPSMETSSWFG